jgi:hypothetical protein
VDVDLVGAVCASATRRFWRDERARLIGTDVLDPSGGVVDEEVSDTGTVSDTGAP